MTRRVVVSEEAEQQIASLYDYLATRASSQTAERFVGAILVRLQGLGETPFQGTRHDHILPGLRTLGFRRRATVAFRVGDDEVVVLGIFYGGQDYETKLRKL